MKMMGRPGGIFLLLAVLGSCLVSYFVSNNAAQAQETPKEANYVKAHYTKYEYRIRREMERSYSRPCMFPKTVLNHIRF